MAPVSDTPPPSREPEHPDFALGGFQCVLQLRQHPVRARMSGFSLRDRYAGLHRRPIDPTPMYIHVTQSAAGVPEPGRPNPHHFPTKLPL